MYLPELKGPYAYIHQAIVKNIANKGSRYPVYAKNIRVITILTDYSLDCIKLLLRHILLYSQVAYSMLKS